LRRIIAVHLDDPEYKHMTDISEVPKHRLAEIRRFFECAAPCWLPPILNALSAANLGTSQRHATQNVHNALVWASMDS
jgi:Inorganic pyrophosphatase